MYEYMVISINATGWITGGRIDYSQLNDRLNQLGREDWELVAAIDTNEYHGETRDVALFLKREK